MTTIQRAIADHREKLLKLRADRVIRKASAVDFSAVDDELRNLLVRVAVKQKDRRFSGDSITGFGGLS